MQQIRMCSCNDGYKVLYLIELQTQNSGIKQGVLLGPEIIDVSPNHLHSLAQAVLLDWPFSLFSNTANVFNWLCVLVFSCDLNELASTLHWCYLLKCHLVK